MQCHSEHRVWKPAPQNKIPESALREEVEQSHTKRLTVQRKLEIVHLFRHQYLGHNGGKSESATLFRWRVPPARTGEGRDSNVTFPCEPRGWPVPAVCPTSTYTRTALARALATLSRSAFEFCAVLWLSSNVEGFSWLCVWSSARWTRACYQTTLQPFLIFRTCIQSNWYSIIIRHLREHAR